MGTRPAGRPTRTRDADASRRRVFEAAIAEFAGRGFTGATVDRIAARARVNKAMVYYHYRDKAALYRAVVGDMFAATRRRVEAVRASGAAPEAQLTAFIAAIAEEGRARPHFPTLWLRELADNAQRLDAGNFNDMVGIIGALGGILEDGRKAGVFRPVSPFVVQMGIVGPLLLFLATAPTRARVSRVTHAPLPDISPDAFLAHVTGMTLGALRPTREARTRARTA